jgi:hypothetical protein
MVGTVVGAVLVVLRVMLLSRTLRVVRVLSRLALLGSHR